MERPKRKASEKITTKVITPKKSKETPGSNSPKRTNPNTTSQTPQGVSDFWDLTKSILTKWPVNDINDVVCDNVIDSALDSTTHDYLLKHLKTIMTSELTTTEIPQEVMSSYDDLLDSIEELNAAAGELGTCVRAFHRAIKRAANNNPLQ